MPYAFFKGINKYDSLNFLSTMYIVLTAVVLSARALIE